MPSVEMKASRPLSPHLFIYRWPVTMVMSILHRITGAALYVGTALLAITPAHGLWVDANFKEDQLARMQPGEKAIFFADVLPGRTFTGRVLSLAPATGAVFSVIPPENATGNFTKIVQRVPVRIVVDDSDGTLGLLRPGLSTTVSVDTRASSENEQ